MIKMESSRKEVSFSKEVEVDCANPKDSCVVYINWDGFAWFYYTLANQGGTTRTPVINRLLEEGVLFENAYTGIPSITNPMQAAIVSGTWPAVTGNCYMYFDKSKNRAVQFRRDNKAETIAEAAVRQNLTVASIHQFILQNRGTVEGDIKKPYIQVGENAGCEARFDAAIKLIRNQPVGQGKSEVRLDHLPRFIAIYMDDLDGVGHNNKAVYGMLRADTEEKRLLNILETLQKMDRKLGEFIDACKERGIYENMTFILTSDHGMAPYGSPGGRDDLYGYSKLPDLVRVIQKAGFKAEVLVSEKPPREDTDVVILTAGLQAQLFFIKENSGQSIEGQAGRVIEAVRDEAYVGDIVKKEELIRRGAGEKFADLLISPEVPFCFQHGQGVYVAGGQHDSTDEKAQHIFSAMWGRGVKKETVYGDRIYTIDFAGTMASLLGMEGPKDATGRILEDVLEGSIA